MTIALVDSDIIAYRSAAASEADPLDICLMRVDKMMRDIINETNASSYLAFLSGPNNFRKEIYPEYKANRKDVVKPAHLADCRQFLCSEWDAVICDGYEADDALGMHQNKSPVEDDLETIICSIDKDLLMIPGNHYNFVKKEFCSVDELEGLRSLYRSALVGDKTDNIHGVRGIGKVKAAKLINDLVSERDMYNTCCQLYNDVDRLDTNLDCLWIFREEGIRWSMRFPY